MGVADRAQASCEMCQYAWAAGLFDGEGSISRQKAYRPGGLYKPVLNLSNNDLELVTRFQEIMGGDVYGPYGRGIGPDGFNRQPRYIWALLGFEAAWDALALMAPWLSHRRLERARDLLLLPE